MDDTKKISSQTADHKNVLPDVVHSQQIPTMEKIVTNETESVLDTGQSPEGAKVQNIDDFSKTESISEQVPSNIEYSITESDQDNQRHASHELLSIKISKEKSPDNSLNIPPTHSIVSDNTIDQEPSRPSWNLDVDHNTHLSKESPVNLALSSDSKDTNNTKSVASKGSSNEDEYVQSNESKRSDESNHSLEEQKDESIGSEYLDSLNDDVSYHSHISNENENSSNNSNEGDEKIEDNSTKSNSDSEEIIKLDIRGHGVPKFPIQAAKIIFGPPPEGSVVVDAAMEPMPAFQTLLSPFLVGASDGIKVEEIFEDVGQSKPDSLDKSPVESLSSGKTEKDLLIEEMTVECAKEKENVESSPVQPKSLQAEDTVSFTTLTTDYKTICEDYEAKLVHFEDAITRRDELIDELTVNLQRSVAERDQFRDHNDHLTHELQNLQHAYAERPQSEMETIKAQLSDYIKYQNMTKDDSTKFYSAVMSGTTSLQSSNGEKDIDREEITVNYSKSDLRSSDSEDFLNGFEAKVVTLLDKFEEYIEGNLRNKLRESIIQVLCDEIGKMRIDYDTEIKDLEAQSQQDKQAYSIETRRLRELLASVKAGDAQIDTLREELDLKHEKEMENLRTYFEKKCSDLERSYSEEVWRGKACSSPAALIGAEGDAADSRRRTRSAELPSFGTEATSMEQALKQIYKKHEQQIEDMKSEHLAYVNELQVRHREAVASLEEQLNRLKADIQTTENTEGNVSLYQQDIDLELEKGGDGGRGDADETARIQVLLSDPDAELANWPLELAALRDKMHGDARSHLDKELPSLRDEVSAGEADKWRQKRNNCFDQNRQLEEVTKERDALQQVASSLQHAVGQLVAYCASAEDELNRTVLATLLASLLPHEQSFLEDSRASSPNLTADLNCSTVSRSRHVHFAPELDGILAALDEEGAAGFLRHQRDLSADIKRELEISLLRLRNEANELLDLSARLAANKVQPQNKMLESSQVEITELVDDLEAEQKENCDNCELHKKTMEEAMSECLQRESLLRSDLESAMVKIAQLMTDRGNSSDVIAEGYGTCVAPDGRRPGASRSLDDTSPRTQINALARDLELLQHERDDLQQQLEAANRQLRSTRQFVEEQAAEREHERDEFAARLQELRDENARLAQRLHANARILAEVEQLETQTREMNQMISDLEARKASTDEELKSSEENVVLMRDIIANLENQLEQKTKREADVLEQLEGMKRTIDERDSKMRALLGELESLRSEKADQSEIACEVCAKEEDKYTELLQKVNEQCRWLEGEVQSRTRLLQHAHEHADSSACAGDHSEDVSLADKMARKQADGVESQPTDVEWVCAVGTVREALRALTRAEDAALKRIADLRMQRDQLHQVAQEVRCERDVLQARMSEQALRISSLSARLTRQRHDADALALQARGELGVALHDANAEVQRLKEELETKDKQLARLRLQLEGKPPATEQSVYGDTTCEERGEAEELASELEAAKERLEALSNQNRSLREALAQRDRQLRELMALKLEEEEPYQRSEQPEAKVSARTLSDVVSISEFDEQDQQMRRAELIAQNISPAFNVREKSPNATLPPNPQHHMSSLNLEQHETVEISPRAGSLPIHLTSTQNREQYKRNVNETTVFGEKNIVEEKETQQRIQDNCSMYPNRDASDTKNVSVEPKKINFSIEAMDKTREEDIASLRELGVMLDLKQENFHDILVQLKNEVKRYRSELDSCKSELKNAEEQQCEFPALKEEVEELKGLLENTMATMENDKKFYENQLENFSSNKKLLEQRLAELTQEVSDKSKDLHLLKEDILRRENMILELAKEKRNLTNKLNELEVRIDELQSRNEALQKHETDNHQMREKIKELEKLEQLVSEKNQQIDSLNQHLDRLDDLQRTLNDKSEELENLKEALRQKSTELYQMQDTVTNLNRDMERVTSENRQLDDYNRELKLRMSKVEKERENASLRLQNSENELERLNTANAELAAKLGEMENLKERMREKESEVESLRAQVNATPPRLASLRHELDFNRRELNDKAFELAKAKLDVTELRNSASEAIKQAADKEAANNELLQQTAALKREIQQLTEEKQQLAQQLEVVVARLREESNISEIKTKLRERAESCHELEMELHDVRDMMESGTRGGARSPTAELERALRDQLHYSHALDDRIMDQILSASSDEHEHVPSLALDTSNTDKWSRGSDGEWGSEALRVQVEHLRARLADKDALISELNRIRDQLVQDWQTVKLRYEAERDNSGRLQLLLESQKETAESLQSQDANMIQILKKRLESAMQSESELLERERALRRRIARLEANSTNLASPTTSPQALRHDLNNESESVERLRGEVSVLRTRLETERERCSEAQAQLQITRRQLDERQREVAKLRAQLAELRRLKQESGEQLARANELLATQATAVADLERKLGAIKQRSKNDSMTEMENVQSPFREMAPDAAALHAELRALRKDLATRSQQNTPTANTDDKDQAIRYLHGRCVRLESWRKALVWQKRYLQRVLSGYARLERTLAQNPPLQHLQHLQQMPHLILSPHPREPRPTGKKLFKCVVTVVVTVLRMEFLVRRRQHARLAANCLLRNEEGDGLAQRNNITGTPVFSPRGVLARRLRLAPQSPLAMPSPRPPRTPHTPLGGTMRTVEGEGKGSPGVNSPRNEFYLLSSPRGDLTPGYLSKLQAVGRCLSRGEGPADVP